MPLEPRDPVTPVQWQEAVDAAEALLRLDSARQYGLVTGGPKLNLTRIEWVQQEAKRRGIIPTERGVELEIKRLIRAYGPGGALSA